MFSLTSRFQQVSNQALTYSFLIIGFIIASSWYQLYQDNAFQSDGLINPVSATMNFRSSRFFGATNKKPKQNARIIFDVNADLTSLFNWNTKQVFAYVVAEYDGDVKPNTRNSVTFWDKIIQDKKDAVLSLENIKSKYTVWDLEDKFAGRNLVLKLKWNIQPWVGPLVFGETITNTNYTLPLENPSSSSSSSSSEKNAQTDATTTRRRRKNRASKAVQQESI